LIEPPEAAAQSRNLQARASDLSQVGIAESANQDFGFAFRPSSTSQRITIRAAAANAMQR
jgi:hypothetical protein